MDGVEQAIRNALAKGEAESRAFRERVYLSAMSALEKSIAARPNATAEEKERRRQALRQTIRRIETEFLPAVEPAAQQPLAAKTPPPVPPERRPEAEAAPGPAVDTDFTAELRPPGPDEAPRYGEGGPALSRRRRPFTWLLIAALVVSSIGIGIWWVWSSGLLLSETERDGRVRMPAALEEEAFSPVDQRSPDSLSAGASSDGTWLTVFTPEDPTTAVAPAGTVVSVVDEGTETVLHIEPSSIDSAVLFDVGQGLLEQMAGKRVVFDIVAKTGEDERTQMSIRCNFAELGDCGRKRYDVETARNEFLFEVEMPDQEPGSGGSIALTPDISQGKTPVDIYSIKVFVPN